MELMGWLALADAGDGREDAPTGTGWSVLQWTSVSRKLLAYCGMNTMRRAS
jgi:ribosomal protein S19E (S16A)